MECRYRCTVLLLLETNTKKTHILSDQPLLVAITNPKMYEPHVTICRNTHTNIDQRLTTEFALLFIYFVVLIKSPWHHHGSNKLVGMYDFFVDEAIVARRFFKAPKSVNMRPQEWQLQQIIRYHKAIIMVGWQPMLGAPRDTSTKTYLEKYDTKCVKICTLYFLIFTKSDHD